MADEKRPIEELKEEVNLNLKVDDDLASNNAAEPDKGSAVPSQNILQSSPPESTGQDDSIKVRVDPLVGKIFADKYEIQSCAGRGGMSAVYRANHLALNKTVAIKLLYTHLSFNAKSIMRFQQEAQVVSHLNHPGIVRLFDFGQDADGQPYLVMEFLNGQPLSDILDAKKTELDIDLCLKYLIQMCEALNHAHKNGVIHRDLKPSNVFVEPDEEKGEQVKITDFGIAKLNAKEEEKRGDLKLTATGEVFGSPLYMSPEQCMGQKVDHRSDIYSLGCLMYEALTGFAPHEGDTVYETMQKHLYDQAELPGKLRPDIRKYSDLEVIVLKAIAKKPQDRYQSVEDLLAALKGATKSSPFNPVNYLTRTFGVARLRSKSRFVFAIFCTCAVIFSAILVVGAGYIWSFKTGYLQSDIPALVPAEEGTWRRMSENAQDLINTGKYDEAKISLAAVEKAARDANKSADVLQTVKKEAMLAQIVGDESTVKKLLPVIAELNSKVEKESQGSEELSLLLESFDGYPDNLPPNRREKFNALAEKLIGWSHRLIGENRFSEAKTLLDSVSVKLSKSKNPNESTLFHSKLAQMELEVLRHRHAQISGGTKYYWSEMRTVYNDLRELRKKPPSAMSPSDSAWVNTLIAYDAGIFGHKKLFSKSSNNALTYFQSPDADPKRKAVGLVMLADAFDRLQLVRDANRLYEESLKLFEAAGDSANASHCYAKIAENLVDQLKPDEAYKFLKAALAKANATSGMDDILKANLYQSLAKVLYSQHQIASAADAYLNEARIKQQLTPPEAWAQSGLLGYVVASNFTKADVDPALLSKSEPFTREWLAILQIELRSVKDEDSRKRLENQIADVEDRLTYLFMKTKRESEAKKLFEERLAALYKAPQQEILLLNEWFPELAKVFVKAPAEKAKLIARVRESEAAARQQMKSLRLAHMLDSYARLYWELDDRKLSVETLKSAAEIAETNFSEAGGYAAEIIKNYALVLAWSGEQDESAKVYAKVQKLMGGG